MTLKRPRSSPHSHGTGGSARATSAMQSWIPVNGPTRAPITLVKAGAEPRARTRGARLPRIVARVVRRPKCYVSLYLLNCSQVHSAPTLAGSLTSYKPLLRNQVEPGFARTRFRLLQRCLLTCCFANPLPVAQLAFLPLLQSPEFAFRSIGLGEAALPADHGRPLGWAKC